MLTRAHYHSVYLSPHLDDAALSCGGQIFEQTSAGKTVLVVTVTAGDPPADALSHLAHSLHDRWGKSVHSPDPVSDMVAQRRAEDILACRILGADHLHWPFPDCVYRRDPQSTAPLYVENADIFGPIHPAEDALLEALEQEMKQLPPCEQVFLPLGVGNHVDHQLTRLAGERCFGTDAGYYEEYPYVTITGALAAALEISADPEAPWRSECIPLSEAALEIKLAAIMAYASQLSSFFTGRDDLERKIRRQARQTAAEATGADVNSLSGPGAAERLWRRDVSR